MKNIYISLKRQKVSKLYLIKAAYDVGYLVLLA